MSSIKKTILVDGKEHFIFIDSSLELNEVEITATDLVSGRVVHISLSSMLKAPTKEIKNDLISLDEQAPTIKTNIFENNMDSEADNKIQQSDQDQSQLINDIFG
jgi:uncharacterized Fe-S cluster-containing protein